MEKLSTFSQPQTQNTEATKDQCSPITLAVLVSVAAAMFPQDADAKAPNNLLQRHAPKTFYTDPAQTFESVGKNRPRTFEVTSEKPITFYISGPAKVTLQLTNKKHEHVQRPTKAKVFVNGTEYQLGHPTNRPALDIGPIALPAGSHEITVTTDEDHEYDISLLGAAEGETPAVLDAYQIEWTDDPSVPDNFQVPCHAHEDTDPEAKAGLDFKFLTDAPPVELEKDKKDGGFAYEITRLSESEEIFVTLTDSNDVTYKSASFQPDEDQTCDFERTNPPAKSEDYNAPDQIALHVTPRINAGTGDVDVKNVPPKQESGLALPTGMECKVINSQSEIPKTSRLFCWQRVKGLIRAWRAMITSKTTDSTKFRYVLDKYPE